MLKGSEKAWNGAQYAAENAADLLAAAKSMAERRKYGLASSLAILSSEEYAKSVALIMESSGLEHTAHPIGAYFRDHKVKHLTGIFYFTLVQVALYVKNVITEIEQDSSVSMADRSHVLLQRFQMDLERLLESQSDPFSEIYEWSASADIAKQRGLYVEYRDDRWYRPYDILEPEYEEQLRVAEGLAFGVTKVFEYVTHEDVRKAYQEHLAKVTVNSSLQVQRP